MRMRGGTGMKSVLVIDIDDSLIEGEERYLLLMEKDDEEIEK